MKMRESLYEGQCSLCVNTRHTAGESPVSTGLPIASPSKILFCTVINDCGVFPNAPNGPSIA